VVGLMRTAAGECAPLNIRVNTVNPAPIETRMMRSLETGFLPGQADAAKAVITQRIPMQRYGTPQEVADLMLFLASDESGYCTGGTYTVDGGIGKLWEPGCAGRSSRSEAALPQGLSVARAEKSRMDLFSFLRHGQIQAFKPRLLESRNLS
jgi:hypothetical protein